MTNHLVPECTGFVSKLMKNTAWVRLNFTTDHYSEEHLTRKAQLFLANELVYKGRSSEIKDLAQNWEVTRFKYAVPLFGRSTVLVYLKKKAD